jgi:hypothetical protein
MVDGEASVMMMAMISSNSLSRQGARTEFSRSESRFLVVAVQRNSIWKNFEPPQFLGSGALCRRKGGLEAVAEAATPPPGAACPGPHGQVVWGPHGSSPSRLLAS